ncbi:flippase [Leptospira sp. WS4.C2]
MKKIITNSIWLVFDKIFKILIGLFVGVWIARYFGPEIFGKYNFANSIIILFSTILPLGTEAILVRELVKNKEQSHNLLSVSFYIHLISGFVFFVCSSLVIYILKSDDDLTLKIGYILSFSLLFRFMAVPRYFFESRTEYKYIIYIENFYFIILSIARIFLLINEFPILYFVFSFLFESICSSVSIFIFYTKFHHDRITVPVNLKSIYRTIRESFPLFISALSIILYMKIDQLMIGTMIGDRETGIYSVAVRLSEFWYFLPLGISSSFYPTLIDKKNKSQIVYTELFQSLHLVLFLMSLLMAIFIQVLGEDIVILLYGEPYIDSVNILKVYIWSGVFVFLGVAGSNYYLIEDKQKFILVKSITGLTINIILNFFWIHQFGVMGAAYATLVSQAIAASLIPCLFREIRPLFLIQINCLKIWQWSIFLHNFLLRYQEDRRNS